MYIIIIIIIITVGARNDQKDQYDAMVQLTQRSMKYERSRWAESFTSDTKEYVRKVVARIRASKLVDVNGLSTIYKVLI